MPMEITTIRIHDRGERSKVDGYVIYAMNNANTTLGIYSTEEKAIKVLDMIESKYTEGNEWLSVAGKVFQMPQDSEVNV